MANDKVHVKGMKMLQKRYTTNGWQGKTLDQGQLGLDLDTLEVRIGTADGQSWANAALVGNRVHIKGTGTFVISAYVVEQEENINEQEVAKVGDIVVVKGALSYNSLTDKPTIPVVNDGQLTINIKEYDNVGKKYQDNNSTFTANQSKSESTATVAATSYVDQKVADEASRAQTAESSLQNRVKAIEDNYATEDFVTTSISGHNTSNTAHDDIRRKIAALEQTASSHLTYQVVSELPSTGQEKIIYLVGPNNDGSGYDYYSEYIWVPQQGQIEARWELLGDTRVDLSEYAKKSEIGNGTVNIKIGSASQGSFTVNQKDNKEIILDVYTKTETSNLIGKANLTIPVQKDESTEENIIFNANAKTDVSYTGKLAAKGYVDDVAEALVGSASTADTIKWAKAAADGVQTNLTAHTGNTNNPHGVTAVQVGAVANVTGDNYVTATKSGTTVTLAHKANTLTTDTLKFAAFKVDAAGHIIEWAEISTLDGNA